MNNITLNNLDPVLPKYVDELAIKLYKSSEFYYTIGMRVWHISKKWVYLSADNWPDRNMIQQPDLCDCATLGCLIQLAWRITEIDKRNTISHKINNPQLITSNFIMNNVEPPQSVIFFGKAMASFSLNGLTCINGISNLVEVFCCNTQQHVDESE